MPRHPLCLACNYPLVGLAGHRCPECGRAFDPADPRTVNDGGPVGAWGRRTLAPTGFATFAILALAVGLILTATGLPREPWVPSAVELRLYAARFAEAWDRQELWRVKIEPRGAAFLCGAALLVLGSAWWMARNALRWLVILARRPGRALRPWRPMRQALAALLVGAGASIVLVGWSVRLARDALDGPGWGAGEVSLTPAEARAVHRAALIDLARPADRAAGLAWFAAACDPADAAFVALLQEAIASERDGTLLAAELRLLAFFRDVRHGPLFDRHAAHASAEVRAAALDAIGLLHAPAYEVVDVVAEPVLSVSLLGEDGGVPLGELLKRRRPEIVRLARVQRTWLDDAPIDLPAPRRALLERAMIAGATAAEREAAARALLRWMGPGHRLRYAEWGVWLAAEDGLRVAASVLEDVPPFVHRTGNPASHFGVPDVYIVTKPVVHLTADRPMVVDLGVVLEEGRPWVAFPKPDDFLVDATPRASARFDLPLFDRASAGVLTDVHEGYPFISPPHQSYVPRFKRSLAAVPVSSAIRPEGLGLRWQSLIVSPQKLPWMAEPTVPAEARYAWWKRLREVPASWVASRGEAERFLYYDGPVGRPAPATVKREGHILSTEGSARPDDAMLDVGWQTAPTFVRTADAPWPRRGMAVVVDGKGGGVRAYEHEVPEGARWGILAAGPALEGRAAPQRLARMLVEHGLTAEEAAGLMACWEEAFFRRPGTRFLLVFGTRDYQKLCRLSMRPGPTELARVGVVMFEFPKESRVGSASADAPRSERPRVR